MRTSRFFLFFRKDRAARWAFLTLVGLAATAVFADFLANKRPLFVEKEGQTQFPAARGIAVDLGFSNWQEAFLNEDWKNYAFEKCVWPLVPFSPTEIDSKNANCRPPRGPQIVAAPRFWHLLGTDEHGRDVLAGLIHGCRTALLVGFLAMAISAFLGVGLGAAAGYFGDDRLKTSLFRFILMLFAAFGAFFWGFFTRSFLLKTTENFGFEILKSLAIAAAFFAAAHFLARLFDQNIDAFLKRVFPKSKIRNPKFSVPLDLLVMRLAEVFQSLPRLILALAVASSMASPSVFGLIFLIGVMSWPSVAIFVRAEMLRVRELNFIESARAMGFSEGFILRKYALPEALSPFVVILAFSVARAILMESSLSFLGIGVPAEAVTWGSLLEQARRHFEAPWLVVAPGVLIFLTVFSLNVLGESLTVWLDPKRRLTH